MLGIADGLELFHGSYIGVSQIDLEKCAPGKDFGRGFYLTSSYEQARQFIRLSVRKQHIESGSNEAGGFVSRFRLRNPEGLCCMVFEYADADWLHFVAANRRKDLFAGLLESYRPYDVIVGKIANDQTARTLQLYVAGAYGEPGTPGADGLAVNLLLPNRLEDQYCFLTPRAVAHLEFEGSDYHGVR